MPKPIFKTTNEINQTAELLSKSVPLYRKAYSDRTAWMMACFSELAYFRFNPPVINDEVTKKIESMLLDKSEEPSRLQAIFQMAIATLCYDHNEEKRVLEEQVGMLDASLIDTFNIDSSQAILVKTNEFLVLAFRGTEVAELKDIKTDIKANLVPCITEGKVHSGFFDAYNSIEQDLNAALAQFPDLPLFITGHSLGGALATVAAKRINHKGGNAACYTFGAPRVSNDHWLMTMKTPIYRVVNSSDGVTMVPPSGVFVTPISWLLGFIPIVGPTVKRWLREKFGGYIHGGDMRFLTNVHKGEFHKAELLTYVDLYYRIKGWLRKNFTFKKFASDHSISVYRAKLAHIAIRRN